jgi:hypothetical protein
VAALAADLRVTVSKHPRYRRLKALAAELRQTPLEFSSIWDSDTTAVHESDRKIIDVRGSRYLDAEVVFDAYGNGRSRGAKGP